MYGICTHQFQNGADSLEFDASEVPLCQSVSLDRMLETEWAFDAHFTAYCPSEDAHEPFPRCNKAILPAIRFAGADLLVHSLVVDWDTPEHKPWPEASVTVEQCVEQFMEAAERFPLLDKWAAIYTTKAGLRIVYRLDTPIPADQFGPKIRWFLTQAIEAGIDCDLLCDWNRIFRCPKATRDGERLWEAEHFQMVRQDDSLPVAALGSLGAADKVVPGSSPKVHAEPMPNIDDALALCHRPDGKPTEFLKMAKKRLRGRECFDCLFNNAPIAGRGQRDTTIHNFVGQVVAMCLPMENSSKEAIFGLFVNPVMELEPDENTPDWLDVLWSAVGRIWEKEAAKHRHLQETQKVERENRVRKKLTLAEQVEEWSKIKLPTDERERTDWISRHLIVSVGKGFYLMGPSGYYRPQEFSEKQLIPAIRSSIPDLIQTQELKADGSGMKDCTTTAIINRHATVVNTIEAIPAIEGGYIHGIDKHNATLVLPSFRRNPDLEAKYDANVDKWLRILFGDRHAEAEAWIGYALAFEDGPTCAMSIVGGQGVGKKMLTVGLSECLENPYLASGDDLTGQWQYGLLRSPFLLVNEGWPSERQGKHPADRFRELVSGDPIMVNQKYASPIACRNAMRIIFTANNLDVIKMLAGKRDLTEEDREALAIRLLHFDVGDQSARWLRANGGVEFTKGWISSDDGARDSDYRVARHFLWLYEKREQFMRGPRLLVEGTGSDEMILLMQTETGSAPQIIEILTIMVQSPARFKGLVVDDESGEAYVTVSAIIEYWRGVYAAATNSRKDLDPSAVRKVLTGITLPIDIESDVYLDIFADPRHAAYTGVDWHRLDLTKLIHAAQRFAWPMDKIARLVQKAKKHRRMQEVKNADK